MPRRSKGARLWLRPARRDKTGKVTKRPIWLILDAGKHIATGCAEGEAQRAEQILAAYIAQKYRPERRDRDLEAIDVQTCCPSTWMIVVTGRLIRRGFFGGSPD